MDHTAYFNLKQPSVNDPVHISELNDNADVIDGAMHFNNLLAQSAYDTADSADSLAQSAYDIAIEAKVAADDATGYANTAQLRADSAYELAETAYNKAEGGGGDNAKADAMYAALDDQSSSEEYPAADKLLPLYNLFEANRMTVGERIISTSGYQYGEEDGHVGLELNRCNIKLDDGIIKFNEASYDNRILFGDPDGTDFSELNGYQIRMRAYTYEDEEGHEIPTGTVVIDGYFGEMSLNQSISVGFPGLEQNMLITDSDVTCNPGWYGEETSLKDIIADIYDKIDSTEIDNDVTIKGNLTIYTSTDDNDDEPTPTIVINDDWYGFQCNTYAEFNGYVTVNSILSSESFSTGDASVEQLHAGSSGEIVTITEDDIQFTEPLASQMTSLRDVVDDIYDQLAHVTPVLPSDVTLSGYLRANEVTSTTDISAGGELTVTGNTSVGGDLAVTGAASIEGTVAITGYMTVDSIEAGDDGFSTGYMLLDAHDLTNTMGWPFIDMEENPPVVSDGGGPESLSTELENIYNMLLNPSFINDVEVNANLNVQYNISASSIETGYLVMDTSGVDITAQQGTWPAYTGEQGSTSLVTTLQDIYTKIESLATRISAIENGA